LLAQAGATSEVAKYGVTCQTETDGSPSCKRPEEQVADFNKETEGYVYYYTYVTPYPVSRDMAFIIERAMTAGYIFNNGGQLPAKHRLPCFVKVPDNLPDFEAQTKLDERIAKALQYLKDLVSQYGK
jgi:hypothetical protein